MKIKGVFYIQRFNVINQLLPLKSNNNHNTSQMMLIYLLQHPFNQCNTVYTDHVLRIVL